MSPALSQTLKTGFLATRPKYYIRKNNFTHQIFTVITLFDLHEHFTIMLLKSQKCHLQFGDGNRTQARSPVKTDHYEQMLHEKRREEAQRRYPILKVLRHDK